MMRVTPLSGDAMASRNCESYRIAMGDRDIPYSVRISSRAKRVRLEISGAAGLLVVIPKRFSLADVPNVLKGKSRWILQKLDYFGSRCDSECARPLGDGDTVPYRGSSLALDICIRPDGRPVVRRDEGVLRVVASDCSPFAIRTIVENWYRREARRAITRRVDSLADAFGLSYNKIYIRNQRTRWGSCSTRGNLNFNWRLVTMPPVVMDYVIIHELSHLEQPNHSRHFWQLVESRCPSYRDHKSWLKEKSLSLSLANTLS
jgi:predicted metal-dependent hydrolase